MRTFHKLLALALALAFPSVSWCQQPGPDQEKQAVQGSQGGQPEAAPAPAQDSLAAAARKAREQKKETSKAPKVFTNENIPTSGGISSIGAPPQDSTAAGAEGATSAGNGEKAWRDRFAKLRHKLEQDKLDLDVMQRELGVLDVQYYSDPVKAMQQELTRSDINEKTAKIDAKKKAIETDQQAIDDAEDELRKAGGDAGWAR